MIEIYQTEKGHYKFQVKTNNGRVLVTSSGSYSSKSGVENAILSLKKTIPDCKTKYIK